jgi:hypothetical protein
MEDFFHGVIAAVIYFLIGACLIALFNWEWNINFKSDYLNAAFLGSIYGIGIWFGRSGLRKERRK